ncbi:hypothetical protein ONS95_013817 [Cadophora gregata]|uniref:uncharacterized protein n=1 Tax=Cadophora gregata TaxID=51156 RepID=UPI0026DCCA1C|nr:uncharacterized protein ONS95_013817 [Cadophora gregata]KAK0114323.1 hypothetical protein ONS95_013817 [Cadophora gregata]
MPLTAPLEEKEAYILKFCRDKSFKNTYYHTASKQHVSMPPPEPGELQRSPSTGLKARLDNVTKGILGSKADDLVIDEYRVCWDGVTPNQDFVITPHPHCKRLFIATGGSFHGWKFMPTIGRYVVEMMDGVLDPELAKRWAWERGAEGGAHKGLLPQLELRDL